MVLVVADGHDEFLRNEQDGLQVGASLPAQAIVFNDNPKSFWGYSDIAHLLPQQLELNETREQARNYRRLAGVVGLVEEGSISQEELDKFFSEKPMPFLFVKKAGNRPLKDRIHMIQKTIPGDLATWGDTMVRDIREQSGMGMNQRGQVSGKSRHPTATEVSVADQHSQTPVSERRLIAVNAMKGAVRKMLNLIFTFWTEDRVANVAGPDGARVWVDYNMEDLKGDYDLVVNPDSAALVSGGKRKRDILEFLQQAGQSGLLPAAIEDGTIDKRGLLEELFREYPTINTSRVLKAPEGSGNRMDMKEYQERMQQGGQGANLPGAMQQVPQAGGVSAPNLGAA